MREQIIAEAKEWINTPFHLHGRVKHIGCDCIGLVIGVAQSLNLKSKLGDVLPHFDHSSYSLRESSIDIEKEMSRHFYLSNSFEAGNLITLQYDSIPRHVGILSKHASGKLSIIHSNIRVNKVVEHIFDDSMLKRTTGIYSFIDC